MKHAITPLRSEDYPEWFQQVIKAADLAENSPVRGCMVIKPWGYGIWEMIQKILDRKFKETGHQNAYFPLFIPLSFFEKEAAHVEGFAKECAVVTHHRLEANAEGKLVPAGELDQPLVVRPTSEMIIGEMFSKWVESYRDLPILINQWANVVRWELRTRMFLRTTEFLWQEGHTAHATRKEAEEETLRMLEVYTRFSEDYLAIPVIKGEKTESERFPGAVSTYAIEMMMQDKKALQGGTSHFLGQNFAKASQIKFSDESGQEQFCWTTSWGVATRLIGGLIMVHSDDDGLVLPPKIAASQIVITPILHGDELKEEILHYCHTLKESLEKIVWSGSPLQVLIDKRDMRGGEKKWSWVKKGIPIRIEIGKRDIATDTLVVGRRDQEKSFSLSRGDFLAKVEGMLEEMQKNMFLKAKEFRDANMIEVKDSEEFYRFFTPKNREKPEIHGGFAVSFFSEDPVIERKLKEDLGVTVRCIPLGNENKGNCIFTGKKDCRQMIFAKSY
jgi:prolyl-tRNA synthetase